ncbi:MAG: hypothetical protein ACYTEQ_15225 [Planctomycetota bacterium]|jgi:hypothetical protein
MSKRRGIRDPWRPGSHTEDLPEQADNTIGSTESEHPLDWDLEPDKRFTMRISGVPNWLMVKGADDEESAARVVLRAIRQCPELEEQLKRYEFVYGPCAEVTAAGFTLTDGHYRLCCPSATDVKDGFHRFLQVIRYANNTVPGFRDKTEEVGLFPVLA